MNKQYGLSNERSFLFLGFILTMEGVFLYSPAFIFFSKVVPKGVEATAIGIFCSVMNVCYQTVREVLGLYIGSDILSVNRTNMDDYPTLKLIALIGNFIPFLFMYHLLPTIDETNALQSEIAHKNRLPSEDEDE